VSDPFRLFQTMSFTARILGTSSPRRRIYLGPSLLGTCRSACHYRGCVSAGFIRSFRSRLDWVKPAGGTLAFPWLADQSDSTPLCEAWAKAGVL
jgi:hypothetical protein